MAAGWRDIGRMSDDEAAALIGGTHRRSGGHDAPPEGNRLLVFARKRAVQVTFAGYPGSTGLEAIDYRLTDVHLDPAGSHDADYGTSWRLPATFWCYDPLGADARRRLARRGGRPDHLRLPQQLLQSERKGPGLWAECSVPSADSRLLLYAMKASPAGCNGARAVRVETGRVEFAAYRPRRSYLSSFGGSTSASIPCLTTGTRRPSIRYGWAYPW